jgi:23S rRNA maturation mini-RNase III
VLHRLAHIPVSTMVQQRVILGKSPKARSTRCNARRALHVQVARKDAQGRFLQQLQLTLRANMDGLKKRAKVSKAKKAAGT